MEGTDYDLREPIKHLPFAVGGRFSQHAQLLYKDLQENFLEVDLDPAPDPQHVNHKIRVAYNYNPQWYRDLFHEQPHWRRDRTEAALERIRRYEDGSFNGHRYAYDFVLRETIADRLVHGFVYQGVDIPGDNVVREFFGYRPLVMPESESLDDRLEESTERLPIASSAPF